MSHHFDALAAESQKQCGEPASAAGDSLSDRFRSAMSFETNKPDSKGLFDINSPVSPFRTCPGATTSSSSSSGSVSAKPASDAKRSDLALAARRSRSGEFLLGANDPVPCAMESRNSKPGHRRSGSVPLRYSGGSLSTATSGIPSSTANSPMTNVLPAGNICPSGRVAKTVLMSRSAVRSDVLGSGTGNYGHGSIIRGDAAIAGGGKPPEVTTASGVDSTLRRAMASSDPEEVKRVGNELYKKGQFTEALKVYDRAISMCPDNSVCRSNRAAALTGLWRLGEAVKECEEALRLDPAFVRARQRLASLHLRLGQVEDARRHLLTSGAQKDQVELLKLQSVERHLRRCADARKLGDWKNALRETDAAIAEGADSSSLLVAARAEAFLRLHQLDDAESSLSNASKLENLSPSCSNAQFFGLISNSYLYVVRAQVETAMGRFDNAIAAAEKAREIDSGNAEVKLILKNVRATARARALGNELFNCRKYMEACLAYGEGLRYDPANPVLYCNRAACWSKLGQWEKSIGDCNEALQIKPNYTKALLRRAASNGELERWHEAVKDYEVLRKQLPDDTNVAEALSHAQIALKTSRGEEASNLKFGREVEEITGLEQFQSAVAIPGISVIHFMVAGNSKCCQISPFVNMLCTRYPSVNFLKVDVNQAPDIAEAENVRTVPTFKIYKNGTRVREMSCPSQQELEYSVRHYGF